MKKLLFAVCALAAISLLAPNAGYAQWENHIGIYTTPDAANHCINPTPVGVPTNIYFVISNPRLGDGTAVTAVNAFELRVLIDGPAGSMFRLAETLPAGAINVGVATDPYNSEYVAGWPGATPVIGGFCSVLTWNVMFLGAGPYNFRLSPTTNPSVAGKMAFNVQVGDEAILVGCMPSSEDFASAVFTAGTPCVIANEPTSFGNVKALFR